MRGRSGVLILTILFTVATAGAARADGLPVLGVDVGSKGVAALKAPVRYVTVRDGRRTIVARTERGSGRILALARIPGTFTIPAVAYDSSASGLSADGTTLVLITPRVSFPRTHTPLAILDANRLQLRKVVDLKGDFSFDAISPRGRTIYLIQYVSPHDPSRYNVRALDTVSGRLLAKPVTDPHETSGKMRGSPLTRATSPDGRWAYTLYDGNGATPFVHALDTIRRTARCIDVAAVFGRRDLWQLRFTVAGGGGTLTIGRAGHPVAVIDTRTFSVSRPAAAARVEATGSSSSWAWPAGAAAAAAFLASFSLVFRHRRRRLAPT